MMLNNPHTCCHDPSAVHHVLQAASTAQAPTVYTRAAEWAKGTTAAKSTSTGQMAEAADCLHCFPRIRRILLRLLPTTAIAAVPRQEEPHFWTLYCVCM